MHQTNPIRALRARRVAVIAALEDYFDNNPLGQKIAQHILKTKEIIRERVNQPHPRPACPSSGRDCRT
ncbi:hypothetical protein SprV_0702292600 [Sparganum proliferum]